jgi:pyrroline-5-carboxylate reductase
MGRTIAILGAGKMGETLIGGLLDAQVCEPGDITATARHQRRCDEVTERFGVATTRDNAAAIAGAGEILLCTKPQVATEVLNDIKAAITEQQLLISIVASLDTRTIEGRLGSPVPVARAMPNTPALIRDGMTAICAGQHATETHLDTAEEIFGKVGRVARLDEKHFDAVTGLSASGPAFIYIVIEALADGGVKMGLPRRTAFELAAQAVHGAASMVLETGEHPALLKDAVTTPAGCTIDGILKLEEGGLRVTLIKTVVEAGTRAGKLIDE